MPANDEFDSERPTANRLTEEILGTYGETPSTLSLRSAGLRLLNRGYHSEAELLFRGAAVTSERPDLTAKITEDIARAILPRLPLKALELVNDLERKWPVSKDSTSLINLKGRVCYELHDLEGAENKYRKAKSYAENKNNKMYIGYTTANLATVAFERGYLKDWQNRYQQAIDILIGSGNEMDSLIVSCNMCFNSFLVGEIDFGLNIIERIERDIKEIHNSWLRGWYEFIKGESELMLGDTAKALKHFSHAHNHASLASNATIQAKAVTWKAILCESSDVPALLKDLESVSHDLYTRGLRADSASLLLIAAKFAESRKLKGQAGRELAINIFGHSSFGNLMDLHYDRLLKTTLLRQPPKRVQPLREFRTRSTALIELKERLVRLAATDVRLLFEGESGTGKSFLAGLVHRKGRGEKRPFIIVDCTNLEENLFESKLFGHTRGAFTGAVANTVGLVEQADGGTLFLDEIGELPLEIQAKLLYTIEEQRFRPVGARVEKRADFRVMAATNRDIDEMLANGTLRGDLYFRIAGYRVHLPPLRDRREDVVPLAELQLERLNEKYGRRKVLRPAVWEILTRYDWPGNVRELNASLERGFHLASGRRIAVEDLGLDSSGHGGQIEDLSWDAVRRDHLLRVLKLCRGNVTRAAKILAMNRTTLIYKLKQLGIERSDFDPSHQERIEQAEEAADAPSLRLVADRKSETAPEDGMDRAE